MNFQEMEKKIRSRKFEDTVDIADGVKVAIPKMDKSKKKSGRKFSDTEQVAPGVLKAKK